MLRWAVAYLAQANLAVHRDDPGFGYRFIANELAEQCFSAWERRIWRVCPQRHLQRVRQETPVAFPSCATDVHEDLSQRDFSVERPDRL